ncbi:MAG: hypothetical protein Q4F65_13130 [Propionibacteriaceae bacterium]|nr:hypothetical protein [Propionibacteriaceae bacterium]
MTPRPATSRTRLPRAVAALAVVPLVACSGPTAATPGSPGSTGSPNAGTPAASHMTTGVFFETDTEPLYLCVGGLAQSLPPQCGGAKVPVANMAWPDLPTGQEVSEVRFTDLLEVRGDWDGTTFRVTTVEPWTPPAPEAPDFGQACADPQGTPLTDHEVLGQVAEAAEALPGLQSSWVSFPDGQPDPETEEMGAAVFNVLVTGDAAEAERTLRDQVDTAEQSWALCVAHADGPDRAELRAAQQRLHEKLPGTALVSGPRVREGRTSLGVTLLEDTPELRQQVEDAVGPEVAPLVAYEGLIRPV